MTGPLTGVRVLDLGHFIAGPFCSMVMGDLGADVIKVENLVGDPIRSTSGGAFAAGNRGKRAICLDLKSPAGARIVEQLCDTADVVSHNFRPGVAGRLGIDADSLRRRDPRLIVIESYSYGIDGPDAMLPGFDQIMQANSGHMYRAGGIGNMPLANRLATVDIANGVLLCYPVIAALYRRRKTGVGATLRASLLNTGLFMLSELVRGPDGVFRGGDVLNSNQTGTHPAESLYEAVDGWVAIVALGDAAGRELANRLDAVDGLSAPVEEWGDDEAAVLAAAVGARTVAEIIELCEESSVWVARCYPDSKDKVFRESVRRGDGLALQTNDDRGVVSFIGSPVNLSRTPADPSARTHTAALGEHTDSILAELGYDAEQISQLHADSVVN